MDKEKTPRLGERGGGRLLPVEGSEPPLRVTSSGLEEAALLVLLPWAAGQGIVPPDLLAARVPGDGPGRRGDLDTLSPGLAGVGPGASPHLGRSLPHELDLEEPLHHGGLDPLHHLLEEIEGLPPVIGTGVAPAVAAEG